MARDQTWAVEKTRVEQNNKEQVEYLVFVDVLGCLLADMALPMLVCLRGT